MKKASVTCGAVMIIGVCTVAQANVVAHAIAPAITINGLVIQPNYLTGVEMSVMPMGGASADEIHLEADIHAAKGEAHGFPEGAWMPYLTIEYTLTKDGSPFKAMGKLMPMAAKVGPHYANDVTMAGPGTYHLTYRISPPSADVMVRHTDSDTGVPAWWKPFTEQWTFVYPLRN